MRHRITADSTRAQRITAVSDIMDNVQGNEDREDGLRELARLVDQHIDLEVQHLFPSTLVAVRGANIIGWAISPVTLSFDFVISNLSGNWRTYRNLRSIRNLIGEAQEAHTSNSPEYRSPEFRGKITTLKSEIEAQSNGSDSARYAYLKGLEQIINSQVLEIRSSMFLSRERAEKERDSFILPDAEVKSARL